MKVVVDTSVWSLALRRNTSLQAVPIHYKRIVAEEIIPHLEAREVILVKKLV